MAHIEDYYEKAMNLISQMFPGDEKMKRGFANYGLWDKKPSTHGGACENQVRHLISQVKGQPKRILDVACGHGGSTALLRESFPNAEIIALNISERQLVWARERGIRAEFMEMDATDLAFDSKRFDLILCVEAAFHFRTREKFLKEAKRVADGGAQLVVSDILWRDVGVLHPGHFPVENMGVDTPDSYSGALEACGWSKSVVEDVTDRTWVPSRDYIFQNVLKRALGGTDGALDGTQLDIKESEKDLVGFVGYYLFSRQASLLHYLFASAFG